MHRATSSTHRPPSARLVLLLGATLAVLGGCAGGEAVTPQALKKAKARWEKAGVRDYEIEWASSGLSNARYAVTVRDGQVETIEGVARDGRRGRLKPAEPRFYGVEGLFMVMADELAQLDRPAPFGQPKGTKAVLRFTPDPVYGFPRRYRRDVLGAPAALAIDVVRFAPAARAARPAPAAARPDPIGR